MGGRGGKCADQAVIKMREKSDAHLAGLCVFFRTYSMLAYVLEKALKVLVRTMCPIMNDRHLTPQDLLHLLGREDVQLYHS